MIHINKKLLKEFSRKTRCEWCGRHCPDGCDAHHLWKRQMSGGSRLDVRIGLISVCRGWYRGQWVSCHEECDRGAISRIDLLAIVAVRENTRSDCIDSVMRFLLRLDKHASTDRMMDGIRKMRPGAGELAVRVLREMGRLPEVRDVRRFPGSIGDR